jgi:molecular chaperone HscA
MAGVQRAAGGSDHHAIDAAIEALARGTEAFAAERMNRGIRQALSGRNIEEV